MPTSKTAIMSIKFPLIAKHRCKEVKVWTYNDADLIMLLTDFG